MNASDKREYGKAALQMSGESELFHGFTENLNVWMSHGDQLAKLPLGYKGIASTTTAPFAAIENSQERIYGIQFHPEVTHTPQGNLILKNFVVGICNARASWTMVSAFLF